MKAYTDGACRISNPGQCSCAWVIFQEDGNGPKYEGARYLGPELHTNNYAEYQGLIACLLFAAQQQLTGLTICCDSTLVINQVAGVWAVKQEELQPHRDLAYALLVRGGHSLKWIRGHEQADDKNDQIGNTYVDHLCNEELDRVLGPSKGNILKEKHASNS